MLKDMINPIRHRIEYGIAALVMFIVQRGSHALAMRRAMRLGWFVYKVMGTRKNVVRKNLAFAFPEKSAEERESIALRCYQNFAKMIFEYIRFPVMTEEELKRLCVIDDLEVFQDALNMRRGVLTVAGHFGNWELMGAAVAKLGYPINFLVGQQHNRLVDNRMNEFRLQAGINIIHMGVALRGVIKALRSNEIVALLADQDAGPEGVFVNFFGRPSSTHQGPAVFILRTGSPLIFASTVRQPDDTQRVSLKLLTFDHLDGVTLENIKEVTQAYTLLLEEEIRNHPDHWFWMHRRWKSVPGTEKE